MFNAWLLATAFASPLVLDIESSIGTDPRIPWGPREFSFSTEDTGTHELDPRALYNLALFAATKLAIGDFEGTLPNNPEKFVDLAYPDLAIAVYRPLPSQLVPRKYVHWALARVLNAMVSNNDYHEKSFFLFWTGPNRVRVKVANLYIGPMPPRMSVDSDASQATSLSSPALNSTKMVMVSGTGSRHANDTQVSINDLSNSLTYEYLYYDLEMTVHDIFMGTLGSINEAAENLDRTRTVDNFGGSFRPFSALCVWVHQEQGIFTYSMLIQGLRHVAVAAMNANNFHECRVLVRRNGAIIANGGYVKMPDPNDPNLRGSTVATS